MIQAKVRHSRTLRDRGGREKAEGFLRPEPVVLAETSLIPDVNVIAPPPNRFTHVITDAQPFFFGREGRSPKPDGQFAAGTQVVLMVDEGGDYCRVCDGSGLYVETLRRGLRRL